MNMMTSRTFLILLFLVNSLSIYFLLHAQHRDGSSGRSPSTEGGRSRQPQTHRRRHLKPWPILPSYLPWSQEAAAVPLRSCEAYFGNGFGRRVDFLSSSSAAVGAGGGGGGGWFRCFYSETLRSSICEGGRLRMVAGRITMSRGGEKLEDVIGRREEEELPVFNDGAFEIEGSGISRRRMVTSDDLDRYIPAGDVSRHTVRELIGSIQVVGAAEFRCDQWVEESTLLVTRIEYANLFHTVTDWYSAYVSSRVTGLPYRPRLVFVDGHCSTQLEDTWRALFSGFIYAKNFSGSVCFRHAIFSPLGYETALFKGLSEEINCSGASALHLWRNPDDRKAARLSEFGEMIRAAFGSPVHKQRLEKPVSVHNVLFVRREDYLAHPRHGGKVQSRLSNEQEVFDSLQSWTDNHLGCKINLVNGLFAHMSMKEQVRAIQEASVIIGAHGAGLTHIVSATPKTVILEIISREYRRPHFALIAQWKGLEYHAIDLSGSYATPSVVVNRLSSIMKSLGC
ncbi:hypothetical protein ACJRO7_025364 [Eucalyptus globulus]|uniref:Glycosyltransferase 61 catalytic domain-containing protein n=1 Tax=Eucalyptus globulus TaxID=34317 RepID=A0ABD3KKV0_EUCGL